MYIIFANAPCLLVSFFIHIVYRYKKLTSICIHYLYIPTYMITYYVFIIISKRSIIFVLNRYYMSVFVNVDYQNAFSILFYFIYFLLCIISQHHFLSSVSYKQSRKYPFTFHFLKLCI